MTYTTSCKSYLVLYFVRCSACGPHPRGFGHPRAARRLCHTAVCHLCSVAAASLRLLVPGASSQQRFSSQPTSPSTRCVTSAELHSQPTSPGTRCVTSAELQQPAYVSWHQVRHLSSVAAASLRLLAPGASERRLSVSYSEQPS